MKKGKKKEENLLRNKVIKEEEKGIVRMGKGSIL